MPRMVSGRILAVVGMALAAVSSPVASHEFWLDPVQFMPETGASVPIAHRNGMNFKGETFPYVRAWFKRFTVVDARGERPVKGTEGDDPAAVVAFPQPGLSILVYHSTPDPLVFETMEKFESYLKDEGLEHIAALHRQLGKPQTGIRELYARCAKALVWVGGGSGSDRAVGLPLELVAERNPYQLGAETSLPVRLLHNGKPIEGVMIKVFNGADPTAPGRVRTDAEGRALIELPNAGKYLLNAVHMTPPSPRDKADWTSLWASLTFARP